MCVLQDYKKIHKSYYRAEIKKVNQINLGRDIKEIKNGVWSASVYTSLKILKN